MERLSKEDLLELVEYRGSDADLDRSLHQWPEELRLLYELLVTDAAEADAFAQKLVQSRKLDQYISQAMAEIPVPEDSSSRILDALGRAAEELDGDRLVRPKLVQVHGNSPVEVRRRQAMRIVVVMALMIFGMALWPFVASDPSSDVEFAQVQQSIEPWVAELDQKESWQEVDGDIEGVVETLNQHFPLGMKARHTTVGNGPLAVDFSSPRNGKVVVFVLEQNASFVSEPQFEVLQISGPFAVALVRVGTLQVLIVTDESMKRITDFLPG